MCIRDRSFSPASNSSKIEQEASKMDAHNIFKTKIDFDSVDAQQTVQNVLGDFEAKASINLSKKELKEMREKLVEVQSKVVKNANYEEMESQDIMFGDVVNLKNENVSNYSDIYSAVYQQNGKKSYFGVSEERVVKSIFFTNGEDVQNSHTYEEYQTLLNNGYDVAGYKLVNQNSLDNERLIIEGRYSQDDVTLVRKLK